RYDLLIMNADGTGQRWVHAADEPDGAFGNAQIQPWSADGRYVTYVATLTQGGGQSPRRALHVVEVQTLRDVKVVDAEIVPQFRWRADSRAVLYVRADTALSRGDSRSAWRFSTHEVSPDGTDRKLRDLDVRQVGAF